jgi:hypothetical protein
VDPELDLELDPELLEAGSFSQQCGIAWRAVEQHRVAARACLLPPATAPDPELDLGWMGLLFCFLFRVFCVRKLDLCVRN